MAASHRAAFEKVGQRRCLGSAAWIWACVLSALTTACAGQHARDRSVAPQAGSDAPSGVALAGTGSTSAWNGAAPTDNPTPNWTGASPASSPPKTLPPERPPAAVDDDDAGTTHRELLDPNARFDWPESSETAAQPDNCKAGTYLGTFTCVFTDSVTGTIMIELTGPVSLTFVKSMDGEFLEISNGEFNAVANDVVGATAMIQGKLDCNTSKLDATAVNGQWAIGDPNFPLIPGGTLEGQITGTLDARTGQLMGQWTFGDPSFGSCPGTWSVTYAP